MQWADFHPYVMPYVTGCPEPTMVHHARLATIEFCRRTLCLTKTQDEFLTDGTTSTVTLFPESGKQFVKVKAVTVDGKSWPLVTPVHGRELQRSGSTADFAFASGSSTVEVFPIQATNISVVVEAAIAPTLTATTFDDELTEYLQDIAHGAIASLQMVPGQTFANPEFASRSQTIFNQRIFTIAAKISRGHMAAKMRSFPDYI